MGNRTDATTECELRRALGKHRAGCRACASEAWIRRYRICSTAGRFYTRQMVLDVAARRWRGIVSRTELGAVLDDDTFLRRRAGEVPESIAKALGFEAIARRSADSAP